MLARLFALALAGVFGTLAAADRVHAGGCGGCGGGRNLSVSGPGHVVSKQGTFTSGTTYAAAPMAMPAYQAAPTMAYTPAGGPAYASPGGAFVNPDGFGNRGGAMLRPNVAGRFARRGR